MVEQLLIAENVAARMRGLLGRDSLATGEGLLLRSPGPIHTWFMRFPIDIVFLDSSMRVVGLRRNLKPWRFAWRPGGTTVVELPKGTIASTRTAVGNKLLMET